jgi:uncharacterized protein YbaR (Trm112 family)
VTTSDAPLDAALEALLVDPENRTPLRRATEAEMATLRARLAEGRLRREDGSALPETLEAAYLREDGAVAYLVEDGIPNFLVELRVTIEGGP